MVLLTSDAVVETLVENDWETLPVQTVVRTGAAGELEVTDHRTWDSLLSAATSPYPCDPSLPVPSSYLQGFGTSGTTGRTKTVLAVASAEAYAATPRDRVSSPRSNRTRR